jgi:hypothetical protein
VLQTTDKRREPIEFAGDGFADSVFILTMRERVKTVSRNCLGGVAGKAGDFAQEVFEPREPFRTAKP